MKKKLMVLSGVVLGVAPIVALAQTTFTGVATNCNNVTPATVNGFLCKISQILGAIVPILIVLGVVYFVWGVVSYMIGGDEEAKKKGRDKIIYGIIGLAVIVGVWGLVRILTTTFGLENTTQITLPTVPY